MDEYAINPKELVRRRSKRIIKPPHLPSKEELEISHRPKRNNSAAKIIEYKCDYCEKSCQRQSQLLLHIRTHRGEKPYECKTCPSKFSAKSSLVRHTRAHTGERPYKCEICGSAFALSQYLKNHTRIHTGEKPFECKFCDYSATQRITLVAHERTHTQERPYKCRFYSFTANRRGILTGHERLHSSGGKRGRKTSKSGRSVCRVCELSTATDADLALHMNSVHKLPAVALLRRVIFIRATPSLDIQV